MFAADAGADGGSLLDAGALADVLGDQLAAPGVVSDGHPLAAAAADDRALEQSRPFSGRALAAFLASALGALAQPLQVLFVSRPGDVGGMRVGDERLSTPREAEGRDGSPVNPATLTVTAIDEGAGVAGVVQHLQDPVMAQRQPGQRVFVRPGLDARGEGEPFGGERLDRGPGGTGALEGGEEAGDGVAHPLVGVEHDPPGGVIDEPDREGSHSCPSGPWSAVRL